MTTHHTDWFISTHSNAELANILSDYSKDVFGVRQYLPASSGRCSLVAALDLLDKAVSEMTPAQRREMHWVG